MRSRLGLFSTLTLGSVNLALLSLYFFPVWGREAGRVLFSSYSSLADHAHTTAAIYFSGLFNLSFKGMLLTSHALAGVKLVIAAAFVAYLIEFARAWALRRQVDRDTTDVVLILAVVGIVLHAVPALALGDPTMIRLYATQMLLIAGAITLIVVERHVALDAPRPSRLHTALAEREAFLGMPVGALTASPPPTPTATAIARIPEARLRAH
jgi:hypothetical protein